MVGKSRLRFMAGVLSLLGACALCAPARAGVLTGNCVVGERPAATLLFPYFEVALDDPGGTTTLIAISNASGQHALARLTLWTEWAVDTLAFDLYLAPNDVQTLNLRDLFATGRVPATAPGIQFGSCNETIGGFNADASFLRRAHSGQKVSGTCFSGGLRGASTATGYVTVDVVRNCFAPNGGGTFSPAFGSLYFTELASNQNLLWGDWFLVTPGQAFATGNSAVHVQADSDAFGTGDYTFYGPLVGFSGIDRRRPLPSRYRARFLRGGPFSGGTKLLVWRDTRSAPTQTTCGEGLTCASAACQPTWFPLGEQNVTVYDEMGQSINRGTAQIFDSAAMRVDIAELAVPYSFGFVDIKFDTSSSRPRQAWVGTEASAAGQYSVAFAATALNDLCAVSP